MLLQEEWPFGDIDEKEAKKLVKGGVRPSFDADVWNSTDAIDTVIKEAMIMCHEQEPSNRATARKVEMYLKSKLEGINSNYALVVEEKNDHSI